MVAASDIEASLGPELASELDGVTVSGVHCVVESDSHARCLADITDDTGDQQLSVDVTFDNNDGTYLWQVQ